MKKSRRKTDEVSYWESFADSMVALVLCLLLIILLLILFYVRAAETANDNTDKEIDNGYQYTEDVRDDDRGDGKKWTDFSSGGGGGGGGSSGGGGGGSSGGGGGGGASASETVDETQELEEIPEEVNEELGPGDGTDRAAVFVKLIDGDTGKNIALKDIGFELYRNEGEHQVLTSYYPTKVDYSSFNTNENGTFYLPERIKLGTYYLRDITDIPGYDAVEDTEFEVTHECDWDEPYVITISVEPSKSIIKIQFNDGEDGSPLEDASFQIVAAEDISTYDGTVRHKKGDVVDLVTMDDSGYGESQQLYLGKYTIRQLRVPKYYAKVTDEPTVTIIKRGDSYESPVNTLTAVKTSVLVTLHDELEANKTISGAKFKVSTSTGKVVGSYETDDTGSFVLSNLEPNTVYSILQETTENHYTIGTDTRKFTVSKDGLIDGKAQGEVIFKNYMIRIAVGVKDKLFQGLVSDMSVTLMDTQGTAVKQWTSSGLEEKIEGLEPGDYLVMLNGKENTTQKISILDSTEIQKFQVECWTFVDIAVIAASILAGIGIIVLLILLLRAGKRRRKMKRARKEQQEELRENG